MSNPHSPSDLSRRAFLATVPAAIAMASCGRQRYTRSDFHVPDRSPVALLAVSDYGGDLADAMSRGLRQLNPDVLRRRVLLKPNLVEYEGEAPINTHPTVVVGAAIAFLRAGAREVVVAEGPGHRRDLEYLLQASGLGELLSQERLAFVDLNHDDVQPVRLRTRFMGLDELLLPVQLLKSDFIVSVAKLKTHHWAGMTASMKNMFGVVPGAVYGWPKNFLHYHGIDNSILDLNATIRPHLAIVDAIVAMEGDGPIMGRPRNVGFVGMSPDLVALDATCARIAGIDPQKLGYLATASSFLGNGEEDRLEHRGEQPARFRTQFDLIPRLTSLRLA